VASGVIRVERGWDAKAGPIGLKSNAGRRRVPIAADLRERPIEHRLAAGCAEGLACGRIRSRPYRPEGVVHRAGITPISQAFTRSGQVPAFPNSSATNWAGGTHPYEVVLHCTSDPNHGWVPNNP
jgi:hypothetical protein